MGSIENWIYHNKEEYDRRLKFKIIELKSKDHIYLKNLKHELDRLFATNYKKVGSYKVYMSSIENKITKTALQNIIYEMKHKQRVAE